MKMVAVAVAGLAFASEARAETPAAAAAKADIQKTFGFVPQFFTQASPRRRCRARGKR